MKKYSLTLILVLVLFVITGGTYAAWTYYNGAVDSQNHNITPSIDVKVEETAKGTIELTTKTLAISIDPTADGTDYNAVLSVTGELVAKYTPKQSAQNDFKGLTATFALTNNKYNEMNIIASFTDTAISTPGTEATLTISNTDLSSKITLGSFNLDTPEKALAFKTALESVSIQITISEKSE